MARIDLRSVHLRKCTFWKLLEVSTWQIAHLRSGHKFPLEKLHIWEVARSFHLTNCTFGKLPEVSTWQIAHLGSCHSEKYAWEVAARENAFGKLSNITARSPYIDAEYYLGNSNPMSSGLKSTSSNIFQQITHIH